MAGIGFELRKLLNRRSILLSTGGYFYATFISVGPLLLCISFILIVRVVLRSPGCCGCGPEPCCLPVSLIPLQAVSSYQAFLQ